jgi:hypothetical protein
VLSPLLLLLLLLPLSLLLLLLLLQDNDRLVSSYSGGWQMRMCLGKLLLQVGARDMNNTEQAQQ